MRHEFAAWIVTNEKNRFWCGNGIAVRRGGHWYVRMNQNPWELLRDPDLIHQLDRSSGR